MDTTEFLRRSFHAGHRRENSGHFIFVHLDGVCTVRIDTRTDSYYIRDRMKDATEQYRKTTLEGASRALKLPRR